jgi:glucose/arabinose dehydrogenase
LLALCGLSSIALAQGPSGQHSSAGKEVEKQAEGDWTDARWNQTVVGPFLASNLKTPGGMVVAKALSIRVGNDGEASVCYDTARPALRAAWTGGFLKFDGRRFGLLVAPAAAGDFVFEARGNCGWQGTEARHAALRLGGHRVVIETLVGDTLVRELPWFENAGGVGVFTREFEIEPGSKDLTQKIFSESKAKSALSAKGAVKFASVEKYGKLVAFALVGNSKATLTTNGDDLSLTFPARTETLRAKLLIWSGKTEKLGDFEKIAGTTSPAAPLAELSGPAAGRWLPAITNAGRIGFPSDGFAVDTITVPYENTWKALMFCSGIDFFSDGSAAVSTIHGDVWRVSGIDDKLRAVTWRRFATGLFQPLGLRVVNDRAYVLGRDQITVLHDEDGDGVADRYENFCNLIDTSTGGHDYVTSLERDAAGNFYYVDPKGVHRVSPDGKTKETLAAGLRNPNGLGVGPGPIITVAPQQGEWTPSSVIFEVKAGDYYGYGGPKITPGRAVGYNAPLCWMPHAFDNSSSSQVWVPDGAWGALGGHMLHLLWGRCAMSLVLRDVVDGQPQGAAVALPGKFLSGPMRGTFNPKDGHLYIAGSTGWQTSAAKDGCLQRVRHTGTVTRTPIAWHAHRNGLKLTFAEPLDKAAAEDSGSYAIHQWNYRYTASYGSKDYSVAEPNKEGRDEVVVRSAKVLPDGKSVFIETAELKPVMQMELRYNLPFTNGASAAGPLYLTLNKLDVPF